MNSSVVDHTFASATEIKLDENCTWIEELAVHKCHYLPRLCRVKLYEHEHLRSNKTWNPPRYVSRQYERNAISLEVSVQPRSVYESYVEDLSQGLTGFSFSFCHLRDPCVEGDMHFTLPEGEITSPHDVNLDAILKLYALRIREGNRRFLADRIEEVKCSNLPNQKDELDRIARFWIEGHPCAMWPSHGYRSTHFAHDMTCQKYQALRSSDNVVQSVDDNLNLDHPLGDGISCGESQVRPSWDRDQIKLMNGVLTKEQDWEREHFDSTMNSYLSSNMPLVAYKIQTFVNQTSADSIQGGI